MVAAGIVTIVSAGNLGKTDQYPKIWGGITSPGTEPTVITVGAVNTRGTLTHADDIATSYSSRGYTVHDGLFKPDLVAPGNKITSLRLNGGTLDKAYPDWALDEEYTSLSGSSMATAFVSGVAALMLEANPDLNPNLTKAILLLTATKMTNVTFKATSIPWNKATAWSTATQPTNWLKSWTSPLGPLRVTSIPDGS